MVVLEIGKRNDRTRSSSHREDPNLIDHVVRREIVEQASLGLGPAPVRLQLAFRQRIEGIDLVANPVREPPAAV